MANANNDSPRRPNPRRKRRTPFQKFMRAYMPLLGVILLVVLFIIFAVGSVKRANERREKERLESLAVESSLAQVRQEMEQEAQALIKEADNYAAACEFEKALEVISRFSGDPDEFDSLVAAKARYEGGEDALVSVENVALIPCLSFGRLIMDPASAFTGKGGDNNRYNYISTAEFTRILQELYENNYMLVDLYDIFTTSKATDGTTKIEQNDLRLPAGKKPVVLVHSQSQGYFNQLILDENGNFLSKVTEDDASYTGSYDFVPLLEDFIASNPGFSYKGARAVLSVSAVKGLFGHELTETATINSLVTALKDRGYTLACNSYGNVGYGMSSLLEIADDLSSWNISVTPLLGETEVLVYARNSDISDTKDPYRGTKFEKLYGAGFKYYFGICYTSSPWMSITDNSIRIGRLLVTGNNLMKNPTMFANLFNPEQVLESK